MKSVCRNSCPSARVLQIERESSLQPRDGLQRAKACSQVPSPCKHQLSHSLPHSPHCPWDKVRKPCHLSLLSRVYYRHLEKPCFVSSLGQCTCRSLGPQLTGGLLRGGTRPAQSESPACPVQASPQPSHPAVVSVVFTRFPPPPEGRHPFDCLSSVRLGPGAESVRGEYLWKEQMEERRTSTAAKI